MPRDYFIDVDYCQVGKHGQPVSGDVFLSRKQKEDNRVISVLADGLGSGIKASVLATLTSTMALKFMSNDTDIRKTAGIIMDVLPVCSERKVGYSTFTIVDIDAAGNTLVIEHDNPPYLVIRGGAGFNPAKSPADLQPGVGDSRERRLEFSRFRAEVGDRIVVFSDGINQSGMGRPHLPLGWGLEAVAAAAIECIAAEPHLSARDLSRRLVDLAVANDQGNPKDDITCAVIYLRRPRRLLVVSGPPFSRKNDALMAQTLDGFRGRKIICGGTTAAIVARELNREVTVNLEPIDTSIPPISSMSRVDLVTEGTITLAKVAEILERGINPESLPPHGAALLVGHLLNSDVIEFLVGTRINEAHQDPNVPVELDLRRNIVKRIRRLLEEKHLKETREQFL